MGGTMRAIIAVILLLVIWGCSDDDKTVTPDPPDELVDTVAPFIVSTCPADGDTGVDVSACIYCIFSEPVDSLCIARWSFYLSEDVPGNFSCRGCTAVFDPAYNLDYLKTYMVTVTKAVKDTAGNCMTDEYNWSFTTISSPQVIAVSPADSDIGVPLDVVITATFSKKMDATTITPESFRMDNNVTGTVVYEDSTATLIPDDSLEYNRIYTTTLTKMITDIEGNPLDSVYTWTFAVVRVPLMPLAVGNRWIYRVREYDTDGNPKADYFDMTKIEKTEYRGSAIWYVDNKSRSYVNYYNGLWRLGIFDDPYLFAQFPGTANIGYLGDPGWAFFNMRERINIIDTRLPVTVEAGHYSCYKYCSYTEDRFEFYHYYAPNVGLVMYEVYQNLPMKSWPVLIERRSLIGFDFIKSPNALY